jgi:hypothetical protein
MADLKICPIRQVLVEDGLLLKWYVNLPPRAPNSKEIKLKTYPLFLFFGSWGSSSPEQTIGVRRSKKVPRFFIDIFWGGLGDEPPL